MEKLIEYLRDFNSKERFFLIGQILDNPKFKPSEKFRKELGKTLGLQIPEQVFSAMDYHIDWIFASLELAAHGDTLRSHPNPNKIIKAQQEDVDFLIAYDDNKQTHLIFIEAKGVTGFTNKQMDSKMERLKQIFGDSGNKYQNVTPHFILMAPSEPTTRLHSNKWPAWAKNTNKNVICLKLSTPENLKSISRCNENGDENKKGTHWKIVSRKYKRD